MGTESQGGEDVFYSWEWLPEYRYTQRYGYSLGRILASMRPRARRRAERPLCQAAVTISVCISMSNFDIPPGEGDLPLEDRLRAREAALSAIMLSRRMLHLLRSGRQASRPDLMVALDLLERVEAGIVARELVA